jgi:hypothetical protein
MVFIAHRVRFPWNKHPARACPHLLDHNDIDSLRQETHDDLKTTIMLSFQVLIICLT